MTQFNQSMFADMARMAGGGASILSGVGRTIRDEVKSRLEEMAQKLELVPREEFESLRLSHEALIKECRAMRNRLDTVDGKGASKPAAKTRRPAAKAPMRKKKKK